MVRILGSHCYDTGSVPGRGTKILHTAWPKNKQKLTEVSEAFQSIRKSLETWVQISAWPLILWVILRPQFSTVKWGGGSDNI